LVLDQKLAALRSQIDACDTELVAILAKRNKITAQVGQIKRDSGKPVYIPEREIELLEARRAQAQAQGVSGDLVEDILRRMMRESYQNQQSELACVAPELSPAVIIGGSGVMGQLFAKQLRRSGIEVRILDKAQYESKDEILAGAKLVLVSVPINKVETIIESLPKLDDDCLLVDITSVKEKPVTAMMNSHKGPVLGLHPMFGPDIEHWVKQTIVVCRGRGDLKSDMLLAQLKIWGTQLVEMDTKKHDEAMQIVQVMRHLTTFVYGQFLAKQTHSLREIKSCSSPIYQLELMMVGRLFAQSPGLYSDIMLAQFDNVESLLEDYQYIYEQTLVKLKNGDKAGLIAGFSDAKSYFSDSAESFLKQSRALLNKANDSKVLD